MLSAKAAVLILDETDRVNSLHSSKYGAMFWICAENSVKNTGMFMLFLSSAYRARPFCFSPCPISEGAGGAWEAGRGHGRDS